MSKERTRTQYALIATPLCFAFLILANLAAEGWLPNGGKRSVVYFVLQYGSLLGLVALALSKRSEIRTFWGKLVQAWKQSVVPSLAKWTVLVIALVQLVHVWLGLPIYPFYEVGMFRWVEPNKTLPEVCGQYRYYWKDGDGETRIWRTRRQHIEWPPDLMGSGWNNEMTFPMTYHWPHLRKNYEYTLETLRKAAGVEELFVGVETVNFSTGEIRFYEDPKQAPEGTFFAGWWKPLFHPTHQRP